MADILDGVWIPVSPAQAETLGQAATPSEFSSALRAMAARAEDREPLGKDEWLIELAADSATRRQCWQALGRMLAAEPLALPQGQVTLDYVLAGGPAIGPQIDYLVTVVSPADVALVAPEVVRFAGKPFAAALRRAARGWDEPQVLFLQLLMGRLGAAYQLAARRRASMLFSADIGAPGPMERALTRATLTSTKAELVEALEDVWNLQTTPERQALMLRAAGGPLGSRRDEPDSSSTAANLLHRLREPTAELIPVIEENYPQLPDDARIPALHLLGEIASPGARDAVVRLLQTNASRNLNLAAAIKSPREDDRPEARENHRQLVAAILSALPQILAGWDDHPVAMQWILNSLRAGQASLSACPALAQWIAQRAQQALERELPPLETLAAQSQLADDQAYELDMQVEWFGILADLLRHVSGQPATRMLEQLLASAFERVQLFAAVSLLALGEPVDAGRLERLAADPAQRWRLWEQLAELDRLSAFPQAYRTQERLAEAEMVQWLEFPTEMGRPPAEIELVAVRAHVDWFLRRWSRYFFRFRHPEFLDGKWFFGMAGPYRTRRVEMGGRKTFSRFQEWESKSLSEHIADYPRNRD